MLKTFDSLFSLCECLCVYFWLFFSPLLAYPILLTYFSNAFNLFSNAFGLAFFSFFLSYTFSIRIAFRNKLLLLFVVVAVYVCLLLFLVLLF